MKIDRGVPMASYLAHEGVSASLLGVVATGTMLHARHYMVTPSKDTKALILGEAAHYALLEPELYALRYGIAPPKGRSNIDKATYAAWTAAHPHFVPLTEEENLAAIGMRDAVAADPDVLRYFEGAGQNEVMLTWNDAETGLACKARPDRICVVDDWTWIVDLKTCRSASAFMFSKAIADYQYHQKAAWYLDALDLLSPRQRRFLFVAVESKPPFATAMYELTDEAIEQGREENRVAIKKLAEAKRTGAWKGYASGINYLDLPKWKQRTA